MERYIRDTCEIIRDAKMSNTYKMAWIRSIVEICVLNPNQSLIRFDQIAEKMFGLYWNQTIFFNLEQGPVTKRPEILQLVQEEILKYQSTHGYKPEWFSKVENKIDVPRQKISTVLGKDVSEKFLNLSNSERKKEVIQIYDLDKNNQTITVHEPHLLAEYSDTLFDLINYRWVQELEQFNQAPRIAAKVRGTDRNKLKRKSLSHFRRYLDLENPEHRCFYTDKKITDTNPHIDHVLPWSYLYSDDLWNLVYVDRSYNSVKGNKIPTEDKIEKLEARNLSLQSLLKARGWSVNPRVEELQMAVEHDWVRKFWVGCKG